MGSVPIPQGASIDAEAQPQSTSIPQGATIDNDAPDPASETRMNMLSGFTGMPTPNMTDQQKADFQTGKAAGAATVTGLSGAAALGSSVMPVLEALAPHLPELDKVVKISKALGYTSLGLKEINDIFHAIKNK